MARRGILSRLRAKLHVRLTGMQKFALLLVLAGFAGVAMVVGLLVLRQSQIKFYMDVNATVTAIDEHCNVLGKAANGTFEAVKTLPCADTDDFLSANAGQELKVAREGFVTLAYDASGLPQSVKLPTSAFDPGKLVPGGKVMIYVDPNHLNEVKTDVTWADLIRALLVMAGCVVIALLGLLLFRLLPPARRVARRGSASQRGEDEDELHDDDHEDDHDGGHDEYEQEDYGEDDRFGRGDEREHRQRRRRRMSVFEREDEDIFADHDSFADHDDIFEPPPPRRSRGA